MRKPLIERLGYARIRALAEQMSIPSFQGGRIVRWRLNDEQDHVLRVLCGELDRYPTADPGFAYVLKPRQIGITTVICFWDALWTALADYEGREVHTALIWDSGKKLKRQIALCSSFLHQLGVPLPAKKDLATYIELPNGSTIEGLTSGGQAAGRGLSFHRFHLSELPYWRDAAATWAGIQGALNDESEVTIETTMNMIDKFASDEWDRKNGYAKVFLPFEMHTEYRRDPDDPRRRLSPGDEAFMRAEGFTDRAAMAWWLHRRDTKMGGDNVRMFREYPQLLRHAFILAEGRWVQAEVETTDPVRKTTAEGIEGVRWIVDWWKLPQDTSGYTTVTVDTALARGQDKSAVVALDRADDSLIACFASDRCHRDDLARVALHVTEEIARFSRQERRPEPSLIVETNGPGKTTYENIIALGGSPIPHHTDEAGKYAALLHARRALESRRVFGPKVMVDEARGLFRKGNDWVGAKDTLMALGIGLIHHERNPYPYREPPPQRTEAEKVVSRVQSRIARRARRR